MPLRASMPWARTRGVPALIVAVAPSSWTITRLRWPVCSCRARTGVLPPQLSLLEPPTMRTGRPCAAAPASAAAASLKLCGTTASLTSVPPAQRERDGDPAGPTGSWKSSGQVVTGPARIEPCELPVGSHELQRCDVGDAARLGDVSADRPERLEPVRTSRSPEPQDRAEWGACLDGHRGLGAREHPAQACE